MYQGWFSLGGLEVGNNARAYGYSTTAACPVYWLAEDDCMALRDRMLGGPFGVETIRDAPWYDPNDPVISEDFLGAYVVSMEGLSDSTRSSTTTQRTGPGGRIGRSRDATRQVRTRMWLTAASMAGLEFGMNWLSASLSENACGAHNTSCGTASMEFYDSCPPERGFVEDFTEWELAATNLATHGTFGKAGPLVTVRENLVTNPRFETAGPTVTVAENLLLTPILSESLDNWFLVSQVSSTAVPGVGRLLEATGNITAGTQFIQATTAQYANVQAGDVVRMVVDVSVPADAPRPVLLAPRVAIRYDGSTDWNSGTPQEIMPGETRRLTVSATATGEATAQAALVAQSGGPIVTGDKLIVHDGWTLEVNPVLPAEPFTGSQQPKVRRNLAHTPAPTVASGPYGGYPGGGGAAASYEAVEAPWSISGRAIRYQYSVRTTETAGHGYRVSQTDFTPDQITTVAYKVRSNYAGVVYTAPGGGVGTGRTIIASSGPVPIEPGQTVEVWSTFSYTSIEGDSRIAVYSTAMQNDLYVDIADPIFYEGPYDPSKSYFDGSTGAPQGYATAWEGTPNASPSYMYDDDFTVEWSGTPNESTSVLTGVSVAGLSQTSNCVAIQSTRWVKGGTHSVRLIPTGTSSPYSYIAIDIPASARAMGTLMATRYQESLLTGTLALYLLRADSPTQSSPMVNVAGEQEARLVYSGLTGTYRAYIYHGGMQGSGDVWWDLALLTAGDYDGPYFDGDTIPGASLPSGKMVIGWASHDLTTLADEEQEFGTRSGVISTYSDFVNQPQFPVEYAQAAVERSAALLVAWEPWDWNAPIGEQPTFAPRVVAGGAHDEHITDWLSEAQSWTSKIPVWVRFAPEMNDTARPWAVGIGTSGYAEATPAEYIDMWRHVYAIKQVVAPDVQMMWNPLNFGAGVHPFEDFYPGDAYVDMLALNGFNWGDVQGTAGWQDSTSVFGFNDPVDGPVPRLKALANGKPWGIAEAASAPDNPTDFLPGGKYYDSYGSWVFDWPENPPYENTADDWITQHGFTEMMMRRAADEGASFVALFHTIKETDWRLTDTAEGRAVMSNVLAWSPNVIDRLPGIDSDFTVSWSGTPDASTSLLQGVSVAGWSTSNCVAIQSSRYLGAGGTKSMRIISTSPTVAECYARLDVPSAIRATQGSTVVATSIIEEVADHRAGTIQFGSAPWSRSPSGRYDVGAEHIRFFADPAHAVTNFRLYGARIMGDPDVWWTDVGLFEGNYDGPYFSGDTEETSVAQYAWTGEPNASESTMEVRESFIRPRTDEEWGELLDQRRRFLHGVKCVSGPFVVQERESSTGAVGRLVEFTLESEVPYVFGAMRTLELPSITPTVVQDVVHNLAPYPSAELAGDPVVVSENLSTNPSLELDAAGWSHLVSGSGLTATSGRVTGELAASGDASFRVVGTASGPGASGYLAARQTVSLPAVTGRRFSISIWAAQLIVSGLPVQGVMEARAIWRNGTTTLRTDALGSIDINGGAVSASSISPPASATNVIVEVRANLSSWSSGDVVRLYADALAVTTP